MSSETTVHGNGGGPRGGAYDVVVVGGGPAGSTAATLVAQHGHRVLLLDRERFPRYRVGESLMPATYWTFERLGVLDELAASGFPKKLSVQFYSPRGNAGAPFYFHEFDRHPSSQTWQVDRVEFDAMMLRNAARHGVEVHQGVNVRDVRFDGERAVGVRARLADGSERSIDARVVVDATGQSALLAHRLGLQDIDPKLRHAAYFTRFRGARRDPGADGGATVHFWTERGRSWFWFIPLPDDVTSVGVIGRDDYLLRRKLEPQAVFEQELAICPRLQERLACAEQVMELRVLRDFSYVSRRIAGDGWVLVGDAFGFLDPIYSTGVFLALKSAEFAADAIADGLAHDDTSAARLGRHGDRYLAGMEALRRMVYAFYDERFSFAKFLKRHPEARQPLVDLLVGNVFRRPVDELFTALETMCELPAPRRLEPVAGGAR